MAGIKAVIFDMDGVLVDSRAVTLASLVEVTRGLGVPATEADFVPYAGTGEENMLRRVLAVYGVEYAPALKQQALAAYERQANSLRPFDGVPDMLLAVHSSGLRTAVASSADGVKLRANLRALGVPDGTFDAVVTGEDMARKKPAPDIFLAAAAKLGLPPSDCVVVEDAPSGIRAAQSAGMRVIAVLTGFSRAQLDAERPDAICERPGELAGAIERLAGQPVRAD